MKNNYLSKKSPLGFTSKTPRVLLNQTLHRNSQNQLLFNQKACVNTTEKTFGLKHVNTIVSKGSQGTDYFRKAVDLSKNDQFSSKKNSVDIEVKNEVYQSKAFSGVTLQLQSRYKSPIQNQKNVNQTPLINDNGTRLRRVGSIQTRQQLYQTSSLPLSARQLTFKNTQYIKQDEFIDRTTTKRDLRLDEQYNDMKLRLKDMGRVTQSNKNSSKGYSDVDCFTKTLIKKFKPQCFELQDKPHQNSGEISSEDSTTEDSQDKQPSTDGTSIKKSQPQILEQDGVLKRSQTESKDIFNKTRPMFLQNRHNILNQELQQQKIKFQMNNKLKGEDENAEQVVSTTLEDYQFMKLLGSGAYATVKLGYNQKTKQHVAIKIYPKYKMNDQTKKQAVQKEIQCMKKLNHPNIVKLYEHFETGKEIYLIQEFVSGVSIQQYIKNKFPKRIMPEQTAKFYFRQIIESLNYMHSQNICHRDLKLDNILINDRNIVKIIDFGFSVSTSQDQKLKMFCGTPSFMAPEIAMKKDYNGFAADIWSLGVILYIMLSGQYPFKGQSERELFQKINKGSFSMPDTISTDAKKLLARIFSVDPAKRPTASEILKDKWLSYKQLDVDNMQQE